MAPLERRDQCRVLVADLQSACARRGEVSPSQQVLVVPHALQVRSGLCDHHLKRSSCCRAGLRCSCFCRRWKSCELERAVLCASLQKKVNEMWCSSSMGALKWHHHQRGHGGPPPEAEQLLPHWIECSCFCRGGNHVNWKEQCFALHCRKRSLTCSAAAAWAP